MALLQAALIIGLPFLKVKGESALRFDIPNLKLYFFGTVIWIKEFYLILIATIFLLILIVFITTIFGRVWCGWLCPQTVLLDLSTRMTSIIGRKKRDFVQKILLLPLTALVSLTLIWYFVPPAETMARLFSSKIITGFFLVQWVVIYSELSFLGRRFCSTICPYSMLQGSLFDSNTLVIAFDESRGEEGCMGCDRCVRVCPMGIDIKKGLRRECIACAECIDACISMTEKRGIEPFIGYRGKVFRNKTLVLGGVTLVVGLILAILILLRPDIDFVVSRDPDSPLKLVNKYTLSIQNNTGNRYRLAVSVEGEFQLIGENTILLPPYTTVHKKLMVRARGADHKVVFVLKGRDILLKREVGFL